MTQKQKITILLAIISILLLLGFFRYISFLFSNNYISEKVKETFRNRRNAIVDMPINTHYNCRNMCSPSTARCYETGHQCMSDMDCPGCQPIFPLLYPDLNSEIKNIPTYSTLTNDISTKTSLFEEGTNVSSVKPVTSSLGVNTWRSQFDQTRKIFDINNRIKNQSTENMPEYQKRYTLSGEFIDNGPLASNETI